MTSVKGQGNTPPEKPYADRAIPILPQGTRLVFDPSQKDQVFGSISELSHVIDAKLSAALVYLNRSKKVIDTKIRIDDLNDMERLRFSGLNLASKYIDEVFEGLRKFLSELFDAAEFKKASSEFNEGLGI